MVIVVCVVVIVVVIVVVVCFCFRKWIKLRKDRFLWKNLSKINIIDMCLILCMSSEVVDIEMVLIGGFFNDSFDYFDSEVFILLRLLL